MRGESRRLQAGHVGACERLAIWFFETNGTKKDVILKNEPKKLFRFNKKLHG
jgi:hypothetical protein